jgi:hypothetical protein
VELEPVATGLSTLSLTCLVWLRPPLVLVQVLVQLLALVRLRVDLSRIRECK